jgi:coniferyl-aldehyde dehydrogenase
MNQQATELESLEAERAKKVFEKQREAYLAKPEPSYEERMSDLKQLKRMLMKHSKEIKQAINEDYGCRSNIESNLADVNASGGIISDISKHLKKWMQPQKRKTGPALIGSKARVIPQPLGVVGVIVPWNFPIYLSIPPIATAFAAGNRCMVKMSENSRNLARVLKEISPKYFPEEKLCFFDETGGVGIEFSKLNFDLMMFTGSPGTAKAVMASAAQNLTPVILELGGKNPVIVDPEYPLQKAVDGIVFAKQLNAGQVCLNVDYVFVHERQKAEFVSALKETVKRMVPDINDKYFTSIIDERSVDRLEGMLKDAEAKGAEVINLSEQEINREAKKFPFYAVLNPTPEMQISQRETFGPITTVRTYKTPEEVINYVNAGERPLGFYVFSNNKKLVKKYISNTMSGGVTVNGCGLHAMPDDLPFGGVGHSGMGHYHGYEGFASFSKLRPVLYQGKFSLLNFVSLPYSDRVKKMLDK